MYKSNKQRSKRKKNRMVTSFNRDVKVPAPYRIPQTQEYEITLKNIFTGTTNGSGIFATYLSFDPSATVTSPFGSVTQFTEFAAIQTLFSNIKLTQFEISMTPSYLDDTKGDTNPAMVIASIPSAPVATPGSYQVVADNADSVMWNLIVDKSGRPVYHSARPPRGLAWAGTAIPNPGASGGVMSGCPGSILFYGTGLPNNTVVFTLKATGHYKLTGRI